VWCCHEIPRFIETEVSHNSKPIADLKTAPVEGGFSTKPYILIFVQILERRGMYSGNLNLPVDNSQFYDIIEYTLSEYLLNQWFEGVMKKRVYAYLRFDVSNILTEVRYEGREK